MECLLGLGARGASQDKGRHAYNDGTEKAMTRQVGEVGSVESDGPGNTRPIIHD
jgi:hypothetical protein